MKFETFAGALIAAVVFVMPAIAHADEQVTEGQTVLSRARPEYDPLGQRIGGFILYPDIYDQETYDSNINATSTNARGDLETSIQPTLKLDSNWGEHALNFHAGSDIVRYGRYSANDYTDYDVGTDGRLDIYHDARMYGSLGYSVLHLPWWSPNIVQGQGKPTQYSDLAAGLAAEKEFNHLSFRLDDAFDRYDFSNVTANNLSVAESRNNFDDERVNLHTNYEIVPGRTAYLLTGYDGRIYDNSTDLFGFNRNSNGYITAVGAKYDVTGLTFLDGYIGYRQQNYQDARLRSIQGLTGNLNMIWNATTLDTVTAGITRDVDETIIANSAGYFATVESLREDHELLRNLLLNATIAHETDSFEGIGRTDEYVRAGAGAKYLLSENFWVTGGYDFATRTTSVPASGAVDDNRIFIGISAHL